MGKAFLRTALLLLTGRQRVRDRRERPRDARTVHAPDHPKHAMEYVLRKRDFPPVVTFTTLKGEDVQIGVRVINYEYDHGTKHQADMTLWVQVRKDGNTTEFSGRHSPYGEAERALNAELARLHPDATAWLIAVSDIILLTAAQVATLDSEWQRVETQTPEGAPYARLKQARADANAHYAAVRQRLREKRGVRVLEASMDSWALCWGVPLNAKELSEYGYQPDARILMDRGGDQIKLEHLTWQNPVVVSVTGATPIAGSFPGYDNTAWAVTAEQWDALNAENVRVSQSCEIA